MPKTGLLFPGQGSQYVGMGYEVYNEIPAARALMDKANDILGFDIGRVIFNGTEEELRLTEIAQPAIFIVSAMYFEKFKLLGNGFDVVAGHSLGEYTALYVAGAVSFEDCLRLVRKRGLLMGQKNSLGTMYAIMGVDMEKIKKCLEEFGDKVVIANINSKSQLVISGDIKEVTKAAGILSEIEGASVKQLNVSGAFHSPLMSEAKKKMEKEIDSVLLETPAVKVIPNILGYAAEDKEVLKNSLKEQMTGQVKWLDTILFMKAMGIEQLYEVGPGDILTKLNKTITFRPKCISLAV